MIPRSHDHLLCGTEAPPSLDPPTLRVVPGDIIAATSSSTVHCTLTKGGLSLQRRRGTLPLQTMKERRAGPALKARALFGRRGDAQEPGVPDSPPVISADERRQECL